MYNKHAQSSLFINCKNSKQKFKKAIELVVKFLKCFNRNKIFQKKFLNFVDTNFKCLVLKYKKNYLNSLIALKPNYHHNNKNECKMVIKMNKDLDLKHEQIIDKLKVKKDMEYLREFYLFNCFYNNLLTQNNQHSLFDNYVKLNLKDLFDNDYLMQKIKTIFLIFLNYSYYNDESKKYKSFKSYCIPYEQLIVNISSRLLNRLCRLLNNLKLFYKTTHITENELFDDESIKNDFKLNGVYEGIKLSNLEYNNYLKLKLFKIISQLNCYLSDYLLFFYKEFSLNQNKHDYSFVNANFDEDYCKYGNELDKLDVKWFPLVNIKWEQFVFKEKLVKNNAYLIKEMRKEKPRFNSNIGATIYVSVDKIVYQYVKLTDNNKNEVEKKSKEKKLNKTKFSKSMHNRIDFSTKKTVSNMCQASKLGTMGDGCVQNNHVSMYV